MLASQFLTGSLIRLDTRGAADPLSVDGWLGNIDLPFFGVEIERQGWLFRADENLELAVRMVDGSLWEIVRIVPPVYKGANCP